MLSKVDRARLVEELRQAPIVQVACGKVGVGRTTYYRLRRADPAFARAADAALAEGRAAVNDLGEAQAIALIKDRHIGAIKFWLQNNDARYGARVPVGAAGGAEPLTREQRALIRRALLAAIPHDNGKG